MGAKCDIGKMCRGCHCVITYFSPDEDKCLYLAFRQYLIMKQSYGTMYGHDNQDFPEKLDQVINGFPSITFNFQKVNGKNSYMLQL